MAVTRIGLSLKTVLFVLALAAMSPAFSVLAADDAGIDSGAPDPGASDDGPSDAGPGDAAPNDPNSGDTLRIPGMPPIPMPRGPHVYGDIGSTFGTPRPGISDLPSTVIGPGGVIRPMPRPDEARRRPPPPPALTPEQRAERIRKALTPKPSLAFVRRHTLDDLYGKLAVAKDEDEAKGLATLIGGIWLRSGSDTANLLMQRSLESIEKKNYPVALELLDRLVELQPNWPEAWNKRASVRFQQGNVDGAMADVEHVLKLEPKHFGALDGMASILQHTGFDKRALEVYRRSLSIYPHQPEIEKIVEKLQLSVEGQGI